MSSVLLIRDTSAVPSGLWRYPHPVSGEISTHNYEQLFALIRETYQANNVPVPDKQTVIDWLCVNVAVPCYEAETKAPLINKFTQGIFAIPASSCCGQAAPVPKETI